jgi:hypothetical protein
MLQRIARNLMIGVTLAALITPGAFATPTGGDPRPGFMQTVLAFLGLA